MSYQEVSVILGDEANCANCFPPSELYLRHCSLLAKFKNCQWWQAWSSYLKCFSFPFVIFRTSSFPFPLWALCFWHPSATFSSVGETSYVLWTSIFTSVLCQLLPLHLAMIYVRLVSPAFWEDLCLPGLVCLSHEGSSSPDFWIVPMAFEICVPRGLFFVD